MRNKENNKDILHNHRPHTHTHDTLTHEKNLLKSFKQNLIPKNESSFHFACASSNCLEHRHKCLNFEIGIEPTWQHGSIRKLAEYEMWISVKTPRPLDGKINAFKLFAVQFVWLSIRYKLNEYFSHFESTSGPLFGLTRTILANRNVNSPPRNVTNRNDDKRRCAVKHSELSLMFSVVRKLFLVTHRIYIFFAHTHTECTYRDKIKILK